MTVVVITKKVYFDITLTLIQLGYVVLIKVTQTDSYLTPFADDNSTMEPPDPFPNSEVKHRSANGSVVRPCESRSSSALYS